MTYSKKILFYSVFIIAFQSNNCSYSSWFNWPKPAGTAALEQFNKIVATHMPAIATAGATV